MASKIKAMSFSKVYPLLVEKARRKNRTKEEVDMLIFYLTGYDEVGLAKQLEKGVSYETLYLEAPLINPNIALIKGRICNVRVEEITDEVEHFARCLDKLVDDLAKGKALDKIMIK